MMIDGLTIINKVINVSSKPYIQDKAKSFRYSTRQISAPINREASSGRVQQDIPGQKHKIRSD